MPEYRAPGVYVEETVYRAKPIEGVATSTTAFVGLTARGPTGTVSPPLTSFAAFERIYGGVEALGVAAPMPSTNYLAHAVAQFFANGGNRLHVVRVAGADATTPPIEAAWDDALAKLLALEDISIVAAPGASALPGDQPAVVNRKLIAHAETPRSWRIAVLDTPPGLEPGQVCTMRALLESSHAALYYPWVRVADPGGAATIDLPPSGAVCGIYARTDTQDGVHRAPANQIISDATSVVRGIGPGEQEILNPLGINCIHAVPGRGIRLWGARTLASDPDYKYVNVRRYLLYLEASITRGSLWAAFEPNGDRLWQATRTIIADFLYDEWRMGALAGSKPEQAFFVRCDRSTMSGKDLDDGWMVCLVGIAPIKPSEFVIFRIVQQTADGRATPYAAFKFLVDTDDGLGGVLALGGFSEVGGVAAGKRKLPGLNKWSNVTLKRGIVSAKTLRHWVARPRSDPGFRRDVTITLVDGTGKPAMRWRLVGARPRGRPPARGTGDMAFEELVLAVTRIDLLSD